MTKQKKQKLKELIKGFPQQPGSYLMKNSNDKVIYVGKAKNLRSRIRSYFTESKDISAKTKHLVNQIDSIDYILTNTEVEAFLLEASLIKKYRPKYNIRLKDDKSYPYIRCSFEEDYPRFYLNRKVKRDGSLYFGPYTSGLAVRQTIRFLNRSFKVRDCTNSFMKSRKRPCMTYQIGRCTAPCVEMIKKNEYRESVNEALDFLRGRSKKVIHSLTQRMKEEARKECFEAAAKLRNSIDAVKAIWEKQHVIAPMGERDQDVIAFVGNESGTLVEILHVRSGRVIGSMPHFIAKLNPNSESEDEKEWLTSFINQYYMENIIPDDLILPVDLTSDIYFLLGEVFKERQNKKVCMIHALDRGQKKLMDLALENAKSHFNDQVTKREKRLTGIEEIQAKLKLPELPLRMECFDVSNFQGKESVASQVVFEEGVPKTDDYRKYKIRTVKGSNDFASMKEVLERRFKHTEYDDPQLIVVDGGKGQLNIAVEVLKEIGRTEISVVGLAKARVQGDFFDKEVEATKERFFLPGRQNPVTFRSHSEALQILVSLRDEAHRFAISFHRKLREATSLKSVLDHLKGVGEKRKKYLLKHFNSVEAIKAANADEIAELPSFNRKLAESVLEQLNERSSK